MSEVTGVEIDGVEYVNPEVGATLFRDGGPYGDQSDAIRDEKVNAAREGREPNFDSLIPLQYKLVAKEEMERRNHVVGSQTHIFEPETTYIAESAPYEKGVKPHEAEKIESPATEEKQSNSEDVAKALGETDDDDFFNLDNK